MVTEYIASGQPVSSRRVAKRYGLNLSAASIRNVLADLEEAGFLHQPHTSAGRVPTDAGFKLFVDALVEMREVSAEDREAVVQRMHALEKNNDVILRESGRLLASMVGAASVVVSPSPEEEVLRQLRFMPLRQGELLAVLVTSSGAVQNRVVTSDDELSEEDLERVHNYLKDVVDGRNLMQIRDVLAQQHTNERGDYALLNRFATELVEQALEHDASHPTVLVEGQHLLFDRPEFSSAEKIRRFLKAFEDRELLLSLLDDTLASGGVHVRIGADAELGEVQDVSVISANYRHSDQSVGTVSVIGPARVDYGKIVPLVGFTAHMIGRTLGDS